MGDNQCTESLASEIVTLILYVPTVDRLALLYHHHIRTLQIQHNPPRLQMPHNNPHPLSLAREWEIRQYLILLLYVSRVEDKDLVLLTVLHQEAEVLGEFDESDLVRAGGLENALTLVGYRGDVVA